MFQAFQAFVITSREGIEAFLIVAISLAYLRKTGRAELTTAVHWGIVAAVALSASGGYLLYHAANQEWLEGPLAIVAAVSVAAMTVHMWRAGRHMKGDMEGRLRTSAQRAGSGAFVGVFLFTVLMISREGMETALLLMQLRQTLNLAFGAVLGVAAAATVALITPIVRTARIVGVLPLWLQWYVRPAGDLTTFTIFPWTGFVFAGAACGVMLATTEDKPAERLMQIVFATVGLVLVALGAYTSTLPSIYRQSSFWTSSPTWFAIRVGILMIGLAALHAMAEMAAHWNLSCRSLARFGQNSLFVYWIHVELVYGYASWLWRGRLPLWSTLVATAAFSMLMYRAVLVVENWRKRSGARSAPQAATA